MKPLYAWGTLCTLAVGCVTGYVFDENGNPVVGATVSIYDCLDAGCYSAQTVTDSSGRYTYNPYLDGDANPDLPYFYSDDTFDFGMVIVVEGQKIPLPGNRCSVREEVVKVHIPTYQQDAGSGQYYTQVDDIRLDRHTYYNPHGCGNVPNYAPDQDWDGLADALEAYYGTSPTNPDTDDDGLNDGVEVRGADQDLVRFSVMREWYPEVDYAHFGATPTHRDHFVQWDYQRIYDDNGVLVSLYPPVEIRDHALTFFDGQDGMPNPDGNDGMRFHVVVGDEIGAQSNQPRMSTVVPFSEPPTIPDRRRPSHLQHVVGFAAWRVCNQTGGICSPVPTLFNTSGFSCTFDGPTDGTTTDIFAGQTQFDNDISHHCVYDAWPTSNLKHDSDIRDVFYVLMHEWGHQMGLRHGGDSEIQNCKPNYRSIMNYAMRSLRSGTLANDKTQFSDGTFPSINEAAVVEINPFHPKSVFDMAYLQDPPFHYDVVAGGMGCSGTDQCVDWNGSGWIEVGTYPWKLRADCHEPVTQDGTLRLLYDYDDIGHIVAELPHQLPDNAPHESIPGQPLPPLPDAGKRPFSHPSGAVDPDTYRALEHLTGREGRAMERFLERAGFDLERDQPFLKRFRTAYKGRDIVSEAARTLYPEGVPKSLTRDALEAEVKEAAEQSIESEIGYAVELERVDCPKPGATVDGFKALVDLLLSNRRGHGAAEFFGSRTLEETVASIREEGRVRVCR